MSFVWIYAKILARNGIVLKFLTISGMKMSTLLKNYLLLIVMMIIKNGYSLKELQYENQSIIYEVDAKASILQDGLIHLKVSWKDNLKNGELYNLIVSNSSLKCPYPICSLYGVLKPQEFLIIPHNNPEFVEPTKCEFQFGCIYRLTVESADVITSKDAIVHIPNCLMNVCKCSKDNKPPSLQVQISFINRNFIILHWYVDLSVMVGTYSKISFLNEISSSNLFVKISEPIHPALPWGGSLTTIVNQSFPFKSLQYVKAQNIVKGNISFEFEDNWKRRNIAILTYIVNKIQCTGNPTNLKIEVPTFKKAITEFTKNSLVSFIFPALICLIFGVLFYFIWKKRSNLNILEFSRNEQACIQLTTPIEMKENINYIDKYIEKAFIDGMADHFEISHTSLDMGPLIGEGAFGQVFKAKTRNIKHLRGQIFVAVKQLKKNSSSDEMQEFLNEIEMHKTVGYHENIVCFVGCCTVRQPFLMIMEYVGCGDLLSYLRVVRNLRKSCSNYETQGNTENCLVPSQGNLKYLDIVFSSNSTESFPEIYKRQQKFSEVETTYTTLSDGSDFQYILNNNELLNFSLQIAKGMQFLEKKNIVHRDLAARNILINEQKVLKISDFGLSRYGIYTNMKTKKLPLRWLSIEAICDSIYSSKSDVWAYGVVLWEIGTLGERPYTSISNHEIIGYLLSGKRLDQPEICSKEMYDIMQHCWNDDPLKRPSFADLYNNLIPKCVYVDISTIRDNYVYPPLT